jgi:hypothetical protein
MRDESSKPLRGRCVICQRLTDNYIGVYGPAELPIALLTMLGVSEAKAKQRIADYSAMFFGCDPGMVPVGEEAWRFVICQPCTEPLDEYGGVAALIASVPVYNPPKT